MIEVEVKINGVPTVVDALKLEKLENGLLADNYREDLSIDTVAEEIKKEVEEKDKAINEAKEFLSKSDKKLIPYYEFEDGDYSLEWYIEERRKARELIRSKV